MTAAIVQARMTSSRLPGKVLMELAGRTVLAHVMKRCQAIEGVNVVCCATSTDISDDAVADEAARLGVYAYRGSLNDVLGRYCGAAEELKADVVLRVTADCPVIDPDICTAVLRLRTDTGADYAANNLPPTWPHGLDCEAFTLEALQKASREAQEPFDREHVTPWLRRTPSISRSNLQGPGGEIATHRWTLDYPEDLAFFKTLFRVLECPPDSVRLSGLLAVLASHPQLETINGARRDSSRDAIETRAQG